MDNLRCRGKIIVNACTVFGGRGNRGSSFVKLQNRSRTVVGSAKMVWLLSGPSSFNQQVVQQLALGISVGQRIGYVEDRFSCGYVGHMEGEELALF